MASGKFITFEGGEGAGKSTHVRLLAERLKQTGHEVMETREPGGTPGAEQIRALLVTGAADRWSPLSEALLNNAARDDHLKRVIRPALESGAWVLCDRFLDSTRAYQGGAGGVDGETLSILEAAVVGNTRPDLTLILDVDVTEGLQRSSDRPSSGRVSEQRFENKGQAFHTQLRQAFLDIAHSEPDRCVVIDAALPKETVAQSIWDEVVSRLAP